jgi:hypothetical protein
MVLFLDHVQQRPDLGPRPNPQTDNKLGLGTRHIESVYVCSIHRHGMFRGCTHLCVSSLSCRMCWENSALSISVSVSSSTSCPATDTLLGLPLVGEFPLELLLGDLANEAFLLPALLPPLLLASSPFVCLVTVCTRDDVRRLANVTQFMANVTQFMAVATNLTWCASFSASCDMNKALWWCIRYMAQIWRMSWYALYMEPIHAKTRKRIAAGTTCQFFPRGNHGLVLWHVECVLGYTVLELLARAG